MYSIKKIVEIIDWFISDESINTCQPGVLLRLRLIAGILLWNILTSAVVWGSSLLLIGFSRSTFFFGSFSVMLAMIFYGIVLNINRYSTDYVLVGNLMGVAGFLIVTTAIYMSGGVPLSPMILYYGCIPVLMFAITDGKSALAWVIIISISTVIFYLINQWGVELPVVYIEKYLQYFWYTNAILLLFVHAASFAIYSAIKRAEDVEVG